MLLKIFRMRADGVAAQGEQRQGENLRAVDFRTSMTARQLFLD
jgi:hypothetical protein